MRKNPPILIVSLLVFAATASAMQEQRSHDSWTSGFVSADDRTIYRAISDEDRSTPMNAFLAVDLPQNCSDGDVSILMWVEDGIDSAGIQKKGDFEARVDRGQTISGQWVTSVNEMGDHVLIMTLSSDDLPSLIKDMKLGNVLRVKAELSDGDGSSFFNFSLAGSRAAITRSEKLCERGVGNTDKEYF